MPVGQEDRFDPRDVEAEPFGVVEPDVAVRADVEQHGAGLVTRPPRQEHRQTVAGDAEMVEHADPDVVVVVPARWYAAEQ